MRDIDERSKTFLNTNRMTACALCAIFILLLLSAGAANAAIITVDDSGGADYTSIQAAINAASPSDIIEVRSGTYFENVVVNKQVILQGTNIGGGQPIVDASGSGSAITLSADGITIEGFMAINSGYTGIGPYDSGIQISSKNNIIKDNIVNNNQIGIYLYLNHWISLDTTDNNTITGNKANNNGGAGISAYWCNNNTITNNEVGDNGEGISLYDCSNNNISWNNVSNNYNGGGITVRYNSNNNTLTANEVNNNNPDSSSFGINIYDRSYYNTISSNNVSNNGNGIKIDDSGYTNITNNNISKNRGSWYGYGIILDYSPRNTLNGNMISENNLNFGLSLSIFDLENYIQNIDTTNKVDGKPIYYWVNQQDLQIPNDAGYVGVINSTNITVRDLTLTNNTQGVLFAYTDKSRIENISALNNRDGIFLKSSPNNTIEDNNVNNNTNGIYLYGSGGDNNSINRNNVSNNSNGIDLYTSDNTLTNNIMFENVYNLKIYEYTLIQNITSTNKVDGKPVYYWINEQNRQIPTDAGYVGVVSSENITVKNLTLMNNYQGMLFAHTNNSKIENISASKNYYGIYLKDCNNNDIIRNNASNNYWMGIDLQSSNNNTIMDNDANTNYYGIYLDQSSNNTILNNNANNNQEGIKVNQNSNNNTISSNNYFSNYHGIYLLYSFNNTLTNNNISLNSYGIHVFGGNNSIYNNYFNQSLNLFFYEVDRNYWNIIKTPGINIFNGPYFAGNFWAKPDGTGFSQTCTDANLDGICDSSYILDSENVDYLPLAVPPQFGYINGTVLDKITKVGITGVIVSTNTDIATTTNESGFYSLYLPPISYTITASSEPIYSPNSSNTVEVVSNITVMQDIELELNPGYINGTVLDNITMIGIADAVVTTDTGDSTVANESGFYSLLLAVGTYNLTATSEPAYYSNSSITVEIITGATVIQDIEFAKKPTGTISGSVTNASS